MQTANGAVQAAQVVIASNAYTEGEWTELRRNFFPGYYYQVASAPLTDDAAQRILPGGQGSWDTRQVLSSIRRDADGRLLLGSLGNGNQKPTWFLKAWADRVQQHYFPYLKSVQWECTWTGCIAFTPDHLMRLFEPRARPGGRDRLQRPRRDHRQRGRQGLCRLLVSPESPGPADSVRADATAGRGGPAQLPV